MTKNSTRRGGRRTKMQDVAEFRRWYTEGRTYQWMVDEYLRKYNLEVSQTMFSAWRTKLGLPNRLVAVDEDMFPWDIRPNHMWLTIMRLLHTEARSRAGAPVPVDQRRRLQDFIAYLKHWDLVVTYEPDTDEGFWLVPREEGDAEFIRTPAAS